MNQYDQVTDRPQDPGTPPAPLNSKKWPALAAAAIPGIPLAAGTTPATNPVTTHGPSIGQVFGTFGHLTWGILGAMPGGHLGGIGIAAAGGTAWYLNMKVSRPKVGVATTRGMNPVGWATKREISRYLSESALLKRATTLQPSLEGTPRRKIDPLLVGLQLGIDVIHKRYLYVSCEDGILVFAPPRAGKTSWLGNQVIDAPGAAVVTTTRGDLYTASVDMRRRGGPVLVMNGDVAGISNTFRWNLILGCEDPVVAVRRAGYILAASASGKDMENGAFWTSNSFRVLRTYLMAAALGGLTLMDVRSWVTNPSNKKAVQIMRANAPRVPAGWAEDLEQAIDAPDKTRDSIYLTLAMSFEFLALPQMADIVTPRPGDRPFDVREFLNSKGTLYLLGEDKPYGSIAPLFSCLTGEIFEIARQMAKESPSGRLDPFLRMILDEAAIICPLPLDRWTADAGGWNIQILISVQSLSQLYQRWGRWGGQTIWNNTNKAVLPGLSVLEDQETISAMVGERKVQSVSHSQTEDGKGSHHTSEGRERIISADKVRTLDPGTGIYFHRSTTALMFGFQAVWDREDVKAFAKDKKKKEKAYAKLLKKNGGVVIPQSIPAPPMPQYKPRVPQQPFPAQAPAAQNDTGEAKSA